MSLLIFQVTFNSPSQPKVFYNSVILRVSNVKWVRNEGKSLTVGHILGWGVLIQNETAEPTLNILYALKQHPR